MKKEKARSEEVCNLCGHKKAFHKEGKYQCYECECPVFILENQNEI